MRVSLLNGSPSFHIKQRREFHSPTKSLLVVGVNLARLLQLGDELADALGIVFGVKVDDEGVDHFCGLLGFDVSLF